MSNLNEQQFKSLADLSKAGYVTDEWKRWQQGDCGTYALALQQEHPHLKFGVLGQSEPDGWRETHFIAHDDTHAYDSAGRHALPYHGVHGDNDVVELNQHADWYGVADEAHPDDLEAARAHIRRHGIGPR